SSRISAFPSHTAPTTQPQQSHDGTPWTVQQRWLCMRVPAGLFLSPALLKRPAIHVSTVPRWPQTLPPNAKPASWEHPRFSAPPSKQPRPH
ncbi:hypothetical protein GOODEAATRI_007125, partial [Goodea atripinnis]